MTLKRIDIKLSLITSEPAPLGEKSHVGSPPVLVRGDINTDNFTFKHTELSNEGEIWSLLPKDQPGSSNEIIGYLLQSLFRSLENSLEVNFFFEVGISYFLFL